jgi:hypothetical protein
MRKLMLALSFLTTSLFSTSCSSDDDVTTDSASSNAYAEISRATCLSVGESSEEVCDCIYETMIENDINSQATAKEKEGLLGNASAQCALSSAGLPDIGDLGGLDLGGLDLSETSDLSDLFSNLDLSNLTTE